MGWFGVLKKGKAGRSKAGFSIFHNKRMVEGWPSSWRPWNIFGGRDGEEGSNNLLNQRLVGEIHLDDFEVAHTKDGMYWRSGEEEGLGKLLDKELADLNSRKYRTKTRGEGLRSR